MRCIDCGKPTKAGRSDGPKKAHLRCLACDTARDLAQFHYPASQSGQAIKRKAAER
jgi:hypothetical protein